jgi:kinetochore protein NDC80
MAPTRSNKTDPRPISDKNFLGSCIHSIISFLTANNYPQPLSPKNFVSPSTKEFHSILLFIYRFVDPGFYSKKPEDDIPQIFKNVKYPFVHTISKRSLASVGSLHTWPTLLGALAWLVELVRYDIAAGEEELEPFEKSNDEQELTRVFFESNAKAYDDFMAGSENVEAYNNQLIAYFDSINEGTSKSVDSLIKLSEETQKEIDVFTNGPVRTLPYQVLHQNISDRIPWKNFTRRNLPY